MSENKIKISLLISTYNWPQALELCLNSVLVQTCLPDEVIVADDGSKEATKNLINEYQKKFPIPLLHAWHEDKGFRAAAIRNKGIAKTTGDYIIQIDGDIILNKNFIKDHISLIKPKTFVEGSRVLLSPKKSKKILSNKRVNLSFCDGEPASYLNGIRIACLRHYFASRYKQKENLFYIKGCNMAFWREDIFAVNGYNEDFEGWGREDSELGARLIHSGIAKQYIKFGAVQYHIYHTFNDRSKDPENLEIFKEAIKNKTKYAENGLSKYL